MQHPTRAEKKRLLDLMSDLDWLFSVSNHARKLTYMNEECPGSPETLADITVTDEYQQLLIRIYPYFWTHDREDQRRSILHEYCHIDVDPLAYVGEQMQKGNLVTKKQHEDAVEKVTSRMANHLDALLRSRKRFARVAYTKYIEPVKKPAKKKKKK